MLDEFWYSVLPGAGLGAVYVAATWIMTRRAMKRPVRSATNAVFLGMLSRLGVAAVLLVTLLLVLPVDPIVLVGSFLACYFVGLIGEVLLLHGAAKAGAANAGAAKAGAADAGVANERTGNTH